MNSIKNVIGLTGLYASGKSTAEKIIKEDYGFFIIDVDKIGHEALLKKKDVIITVFGRNILEGENINRKAFGKIVFSDKNKLKLLNSIVHPFMISRVEEIITTSKETKICINAALLFEMGLDQFCKKIIITKTNLFETIKRAKKRNKTSFFQVLKILSYQKVLKFAKKNLKNAEIFYVDNNGKLNNLKKQLDDILS